MMRWKPKDRLICCRPATLEQAVDQYALATGLREGYRACSVDAGSACRPIWVVTLRSMDEGIAAIGTELSRTSGVFLRY